jgi:hypothetical protein
MSKARMMSKAIRIALLSSALICGTAGVVSAQWYPPGTDEYSTYRIPGTDEFFTGRGQVEINSYPAVRQNTSKVQPKHVQRKSQPIGTEKAHRPTVVQRNASLGG